MEPAERRHNPAAGVAHVPHAVIREDRGDGSIVLTTPLASDPVARNACEWLDHWAQAAPQRVFIAERSGKGWREVTFSQMRDMARAVGASLVARGMHEATPLAILSGNSVDHAIMALGSAYAGVPHVPLAEQYSLIPEARDRLRYILGKVRPAMVFADDATRYLGALAMPELDGVERVVSNAQGAGVPVTTLEELLKGADMVALDEAHARVGHGTLAKILFTSGSTSHPKGVRTTHKMICHNQAQIAACLPFLKDRPPKILDWLPWNHVFGGSHNFYMMLANGGSLYIDEGKPVKGLFDASLRNLREHAGTLSFNVPVGFALLAAAMKDDAQLRRAFFRDLDLIFYAGASLPQATWMALQELAMAELGHVPMMISSWGMTETAPGCLIVHEPIDRSGVIGVPMPQTRIKLIPDEDMRCELRVAGPNVMDGYFEDPEKSAESFDEEGYLITGDAVRFLDPADPARGLVFDGRISEDFKLLTGTWVRASNLRLEALKEFSKIASDIVITGQDRNEIGVLVFANPAAIEAAGIEVASDGEALHGVQLHEVVTALLARVNEHGTGSSTRIARVMVMSEPPSVGDAEITAKGNLNFRAVLKRRAKLVERLYDDNDPAVVLNPESTANG